MWVQLKFHKKLLWPFYRWMNKSDLILKIEAYRKKKGWNLSDTALNLSKSIFIEAAELLECFQSDSLNSEAIEAELADVLMYALALAIDLDCDIEELILKKWEDVDQRYPDVD